MLFFHSYCNVTVFVSVYAFLEEVCGSASLHVNVIIIVIITCFLTHFKYGSPYIIISK